jgi:hypothetical protein
VGFEFGFRGLPAGATGTVAPAGTSDGGVAALDGDTGVWGSGGPEALRASEIPPSASDNKTDSTNPMVFIARLFTSSSRVDVISALKQIASNIAGHEHDNHQEKQPDDTTGRVTPFPAVRPTGNHAKHRQNQDDQESHSP